MTYKEWFDEFGAKHKSIVKKLSNLNKDEIIEYFDYDNMRVKEPDFCPLYKKNKKCHDIEHLNCYLCGCPYFRVGERKSSCSIDAKDGSTIEAKDGYIHQNCSACTIPHKVSFVKKNFDRNWQTIMKDTIL